MVRDEAVCDAGRVDAPDAVDQRLREDAFLTSDNHRGGGGSSEPALRVAHGRVAASHLGLSHTLTSTARYRRSAARGHGARARLASKDAFAGGSRGSRLAATSGSTGDLASLPWLVLQVTPGREDAAARRVLAVAGDTVCDCFALRRQTFFRERGVWGVRESSAYPGYLFAIVRNMDAFLDAFSLIARDDIRLVAPDGAGTCACLTAREARLVVELTGGTHVIEASTGRIVEGRLVVERGPIRGREDLVTKIDRHRRSAWLDMGLPGSPSVSVALEVVSKS